MSGPKLTPPPNEALHLTVTPLACESVSPAGERKRYVDRTGWGTGTMRINYSIVFVSEMKRSVAFYRDVIGIPLKFESPEWTEFVTEGATLALHKGDAPTPDATTRGAEEAGQCRAGFQVPDLDAFHKRMTEHKVSCVQEPTETFGVRIAQYLDPDGLILSVSGVRTNEQQRD